ncbi:hypothetical protein [Cyanobium sp. ATX 6F1]|uniref:hypothetical protein n=1 Tax=unclassified Cyanobium TaxID=2627006 RepID=UPI0020CB7E03|nr:hypothetical protein [Cyanobium sp. ATX 6F1]MCP9915330.1 hypothetical protein [Cyanobium sp. ATX 6F1]
MTKRTRELQPQPEAASQSYVTYAQQQQWPNQDSSLSEGEELDAVDDSELDPLDDEPLDPIEEPATTGDEPAAEPDALKAERRKTNQLERDLRTLKRQLSQFSKINPDEYERLQEAERQKVQLEREIATRERQLEAAAARKVKAVAKERDDALAEVQQLRKDRLLERLFVDAEGRPGGDNRGSFFEIFKQQVGGEFRLTKDGNSRDVLEPIDSKGNALLSDNGNLQAAEHVESLRTHPVLGFLFQQRGGIGPTTVIAEFDGNGQATNLQSMSASELYLASYARKPTGARS